MKHLYLALATAVLSLLGIDAVFPNRTSVSSPRSEATKHHQGLSQSTPTKIDGCTKWRYLKNSSTSNEDIWRHALSALKDPYAACTLLVVCGLHQEEEERMQQAFVSTLRNCYDRKYYIFGGSYHIFPVVLVAEVPCRMLMTLFMYGEATNYFWMFVEGLHLHMMVVSGYSHDRIPMKVYAAIGWGGPGILAILWIALKSILDNTGCWYTSISGKSFDYVFQAPIIVLLTLNLGILITVVSIIFTKLRPGYNISGGTGQNEKEKYVKATKAALFLFPLLGFTYLVFLISPSTKDAVLAFWYFNSFAQSFQGFLVCMIYCFGNNEVKKAREDKVRHWRMQSRWSCCWPKDGIGLSRSLSNASTNNTNLLNSRTKDGRELQPSHSTKSEYAAARMHNEGTSVDLASTAERAWCSRHVGEISAEAVELAPMNEVKSLRENESAI